MRFSLSRRAAAALAGILLLSCTDAPVSPRSLSSSTAAFDGTPATPGKIVISQVYGGGGNGSATYQNDFVELFNAGGTAVTIDGWSMQYATNAGTFGTPTALSGTIPPGGYYLIQQFSGGAIGSLLPGADAVGTVNMNATNAKVLIATTTSVIGGNCPTADSRVVDIVGYGTNSVVCAPMTSNLSSTSAAIRAGAGCGTTFATGTPAPRWSHTTAAPCGGVVIPPTTPIVTTVNISGPTAMSVNDVATFTVTSILDQNGNPITPTSSITWNSTASGVVSINPGTGAATALAAGTTKISATADGKKSNDIDVTVTAVVSFPNRSGAVLISQIYGGGGNSGSTLKNDFIELFNPGTTAIDLTGWSVQQTSASGTSWSVTALSGTIQPGKYYLVQEAAQGGGSVDLPTPDATGTIAMGAGAGKVLVAQTTTPFTVGCPSGNAVVNLAAYGTGTDCGPAAPTPSATASDIRLNGGCLDTGNPTNDFVTGTASPRNSAVAAHSCVLGPVANVVITGNNSVSVGSPLQLSAKAFDASGNQLTLPITWSSSNPSMATVSATGVVTGVATSDDPVIISASATKDGVTVSANLLVTVTNPGGINWLDISYNSTSLPAGFQATFSVLRARDANGGNVIPATFSIEALDPDLAVVLVPPQGDGTTIAAIAAPSDPARKARFRITATPTSGGAAYVFTTGSSTSLTVEPRVTISTSLYGNNEEFGDPTPASTSTPNDLLIRRDQHTISYNQSRGTPNWVSYELDSRQLGTEDRCNCFTADAKLPVANQIFYSDYTNGGYDRGHMQPSADRTGANVDNASTFYMTNMVPQVGGLNQGVWANLENALRDSVRAGRAVYILVGPLYSRSKTLTFLKNAGKVAIPDSTWKIAFIGPNTGGSPFTRGSLTSWDDLAGVSVVAVNMPNTIADSAALRRADWHTYLTSVDKIEDATGYNFLSLLNTAFQDAIEAGDHAPVAKYSFTGTQVEGSAIAFDGSASTDSDIGSTDLPRTEVLSYQWHFGDGTADVTGKTASHTFADNGTYDVTLMVTDVYGWQRTLTKQVVIANVNPTATFAPPATGVEGSVFSLSLTGANDVSSVDLSSLTYAFDCGSGYSTPQTFATFNCTPPDNGTYTVRARVIDKDGGFTEYTGSLTASNANPSAVFSAPNVNEGSAIVLSLGSATDPSAVDAASLKFAFDCGSGFGDASSNSTASCPTTDNGSRTVRGRVIDKDGGSAEYAATVAVANVAPTGTLGTPASVDEGSLIPMSITDVADVSSDDAIAGFTYAYDCGAGFAAAYAPPTARCPTTDNGTRTVRIRIIDKDGGATELSRSVTITNVTPTVSLSSSTLSILSGQSVSVTGGFADPGADSPWQYAFAWGVGANTTGSFSASGANATASRQYLTAGSYTVSFVVTDKDGAAATKALTVSVGRREIIADANPNVVNLNDNGNGDLTVKLYSDANVDVSKVDVASVRIGTVGVIRKNNGSFDAGLEGGDKRLALKFDRKALIAAGVLTAESTELVITATLTNGVQIQGQASIRTH
jgi:DNA/RNA endonuclease G (NUC1)